MKKTRQKFELYAVLTYTGNDTIDDLIIKISDRFIEVATDLLSVNNIDLDNYTYYNNVFNLIELLEDFSDICCDDIINQVIDDTLIYTDDVWDVAKYIFCNPWEFEKCYFLEELYYIISTNITIKIDYEE